MYLKDEGVKHRDCLMASVQSGTEMATCFMAIISRSGVQAAEGKKQLEEESGGGGDRWGSGGSKGTTPTEPLRYNSANETLEQ